MTITASPDQRPVVLVGMMGAGKTSVGKRLARRLDRRFVDADEEIERAAAMSVAEIFRTFGESHFREGERKVIARLVQDGPLVLATGGGAFVDPETRAAIKRHAISIWVRAELDVLVRRTSGRATRPLLLSGDPRATLAALMRQREPFYAQADMIVDSTDDVIDVTVERVAAALAAHGPTTGRAVAPGA